MIYPLQAAPINKIPKHHLDALDITIRETAKGIIGLPIHNTPNSMLYSARRFRGLGLVYARKEVLLQHFAINKKLSTIDDELFSRIHDCKAEMSRCREDLGVNGDTSRQLRNAVRDQEFEKWSSMDYAGVGIKHFKFYPKANQFVNNKCGLSGSEWTAALKLSFGYANLSGVPGVAQVSNRNCRRCNCETETIQHVLGTCPFGTNRRDARHHSLKHKIADLLKQKGYYTVDEAACRDTAGSNRFIDILAFEPNSKNAYLIDPTIRYETNRPMDEIVQNEKRSIYEPCINDLRDKYKHLGERNYEVIGVWMGARGTVGESLLSLFNRFDLPKDQLPAMAAKAISDSIRMIHHYIYST